MFAQTVPLNGQWIAYNRAGSPSLPNQCFRAANVSINNSYLQLTTKLESFTCASIDFPEPGTPCSYSSGWVTMGTFNFLYGTVEFRAKFGGGSNVGAWNFVWMADVSCQASDPGGTDDRCNNQEIDIAEVWGDFTQVNQQIHVNNFANNDGGKINAGFDVSAGFHVYQLVWSAGSLIWTIDGVQTSSVVQSYVPNAPMYLKMTNALGGSGSIVGGAIVNAALPWTTLIDYVKVTQGGSTVFFDDFLG